MFDTKKIMPFLCAGSLAAALCALPTAPARADVKSGVDAWSAGNYEAAVKAWKPLAEKGDPDAQFNLAQAYKMGRGVPMDVAKAQELYGKAAASGHVQAADVYGLLLFQSGQREKALPYVKAAAERGDPRAQYILGVAHFNGDLMAKDWVRAYALVSLAREAGLQPATNALAQMDQHVSLADRQSAVTLAARIAAEAQATRQRQSAAEELGTPISPAVPAKIAAASPQAALPARPPVREGPASAGADFARPAPPPIAAAKIAPVPAPKPASAPTPKPVAAAPVASAPAAAGTWRVQLGAFGVAANAEAAWAKVKSRPELAGHGKLLVPAGRLMKLQAGGFASRGAAEAACARLSSAGFACLPVTN